jgi:DNA topoisomerase I
MTRLLRSDCSGPGISRRRRGKGFEYRDDEGNRITDPEDVARIRELGIPPAWEDVWICPNPRGHLQATGTDAAGRKQYLYHEAWRTRRDAEKFVDMVRFAHALPDLREHVQADLEGDELTRERVLACAVRLLDRGFFRIGSEQYAVQNESYGLATMRKEHVTISADGEMVFDYPAKSGIRRVQAIVDPVALDIVKALRRRRGGGDELLAFKEGRRWRDVRSDDINAYLQDALGPGFSAKDFRTWAATVLAAVALAVEGDGDRPDRAVVRVVKDVARQLGNTPAVARGSYVDPRVVEQFEHGETVGDAVDEALDGIGDRDEDEVPPDLLAEIEAAVVDLVERAPRR